MYKGYRFTIEQIHEKLGIKTNLDEWSKMILIVCNFKYNEDFIQIDNKRLYSDNAANRMFINNNLINMKKSGMSIEYLKKYEKEQYELLKEKPWIPEIIKKYFDFGDNPFTCKEIQREIMFDGNIIELAKLLRESLGKPKHTTIKGIHGKFYFLKLKEGIKDKRKYF